MVPNESKLVEIQLGEILFQTLRGGDFGVLAALGVFGDLTSPAW